MHLRTSERGSFKRCPQRWEWGIKEELTPRTAANPLWFGTLVHMALAEWYRTGLKRGPHPAQTFEELIKDDSPDRIVKIPLDSEEAEKEYVDALDLGVDMLTRYIEEYGRDEKKFYISTEQDFQVWIPKLRSKVKRGIHYDGTFDGVYRDMDTGHIWLDEHKTAAGINLNHLPLDYQAGSYWAMAYTVLVSQGLIKREDRIRGIMFNFLRKAMRDMRDQDEEGRYTNKPIKAHYHLALKEAGLPLSAYHLLKIEDLKELARLNRVKVLGDVSKSQPPAYFIRHPVYRSVRERRTQILRIQQDAWHIEQARTNPEYPIMKNPTKDCSWDCAFFRMCQLHEHGDLEAVEDMKEALFMKRDPYADHRKSS